MKILLVGASGMVGSRVLSEAVSRGHEVIAAARNSEQFAVGPKVSAISLDARDATAVAQAAADVDVIVSTTSSRGDGDLNERAISICDGLTEAARRTNKRLLVVGGAGSLTTPEGGIYLETLPEAYRRGPAAMVAARDYMQTVKDVDWTFLSCPAGIAPGERTGKYRTGGTALLLREDNTPSNISAEDFAVALVDELERPTRKREQMTAAY